MKRSLIAAALAAGWFLTPAFAADPAEEVTILEDGYNWSGVYVGVQAGYGWAGNQYEISTPIGVLSEDFDSDGFIGGLTLGANWQVGALVYGIEGDISYSDISAGPDVLGVPCNQDGFEEDGCAAGIDWFGTGRARLGYAIDNFLPYVTGGFAVGGLDGEITDDHCGASSCTYDETQIGWTAGAGVEWGLTQQISLKAEYLHVDFGSVDLHPNNRNTDPTADIDLDLVRIGLNYRF